MNVAEALERAVTIIEERGHCQSGGLRDDRGRVCVMGALYGEALCTRSVMDAIEGAIGGPGVGTWNDRTPTAEVLATLRAIAAVWRAKNLPVQGASEPDLVRLQTNPCKMVL